MTVDRKFRSMRKYAVVCTNRPNTTTLKGRWKGEKKKIKKNRT